jgi:hypothetical protein
MLAGASSATCHCAPPRAIRWKQRNANPDRCGVSSAAEYSWLSSASRADDQSGALSCLGRGQLATAALETPGQAQRT